MHLLRKSFVSIAALAAVTLASATPAYADLPLLDNLTSGTALQSTTDSVQQTEQSVTQDLTPVNQIVAPVTQTVNQATAPVTSVVNNTLNSAAPITDPVVAPVTQTVNQVVNNVANPVVQSVVPPVVKTVAPVINNVTAPVASVVTPVVTGTVGTVGSVVTPVVSGVTGIPRPIVPNLPSGSAPARPTAAPAASAPMAAPGINQSTELIQTDENGTVLMSAPASFVIPGYVLSTQKRSLPALQKATYRDLSNGGGSLRSTITEASTYTFPVGMLMILAGFILLNGRIDRNERKLRDAPMRNTRRKDRVQFT